MEELLFETIHHSFFKKPILDIRFLIIVFGALATYFWWRHEKRHQSNESEDKALHDSIRKEKEQLSDSITILEQEMEENIFKINEKMDKQTEKFGMIISSLKDGFNQLDKALSVYTEKTNAKVESILKILQEGIKK